MELYNTLRDTSGNNINGALSYLINSGISDASYNLYELKFTSNVLDDSLTIQSNRVNFMSVPNIETSTVNVNFQNVSIPILSSGTNLTKNVTFTIRIDKDYNVIKALERSMNTTINGEFLPGDYKKGFKWTIDLIVYANNLRSTNYDLMPVRLYKFHDCKITNIQSYTFDYSNTNSPTTTVHFIYSTVEIRNYTKNKETGAYTNIYVLEE